ACPGPQGEGGTGRRDRRRTHRRARRRRDQARAARSVRAGRAFGPALGGAQSGGGGGVLPAAAEGTRARGRGSGRSGRGRGTHRRTRGRDRQRRPRRDERNEGGQVNIEIAALRMLEAEKNIPFDELIATLETALLTAYRHVDGHQPHARVVIDSKTGAIQVMAEERDADGNLIAEWDDTPEDFGRIAATTARQVIMQRIRDAEHEQRFGEFSTHEGE